MGAFEKGRRPTDRKDRNDVEARHGGAARVGKEDRQRRRRRLRRQRRKAEEKEEFDSFEQKFDSAKQNVDNPEHVGPGFEHLPRAIGCGRQGDAFPADQWVILVIFRNEIKIPRNLSENDKENPKVTLDFNAKKLTIETEN